MLQYSHMPSRKIFTVLIVCIALVVSVFIYQRYGKQNENVINGEITSESDRENIDLNYDWKKVLTDTSSSSITWMKTTNTVEETTLTDQVAKDFFRQFLILKKNNGQVTESDALTIAKNALSSEELAKIKGAQYIESNLHITNTVNDQTVKAYYNSMLEVANIWQSHPIAQEFTITKNAIASQKESELSKLDPIIADYKKIIVLLLNMTVPADAKQAHLELLNNTSNVLFSIEAMRSTFSDPIKGLLGMDRYEMYMKNLAISAQKIQTYFTLKKVVK